MAAQLIEIFATGFDYSGDPLSGGVVTVYAAGTTTPAYVWTDRAKTSPTPTGISTFTLDAQGRYTVYGDGNYKFVVADSDAVVVRTIDNAEYYGVPIGLTDQTYTTTIYPADIIAKGPWVDVRAYGATGDGSTNDYSFIAAAIATGKNVYFPKPAVSYDIGSMLTVSTTGQKLFGDMATITMTSNDTTAIKVTADYVEITGLDLVGNGVGGGAAGASFPDDNGAGIVVWRADHVHIHGNKLTGFTTDFANVQAAGGAIYLSGAKYCLIENNACSNSVYGILIDSYLNNYSIHNKVVNNNVTTAYGGIVTDHAASDANNNSGNLISGNYIGACEVYGVALTYGYDSVVSNNTIESLTEDDTRYAAICTRGSVKVSITDNIINGSSGYGITLGDNNVNVTVAQGSAVSIVGNKISDCLYAGIHFQQEGYVRVAITDNYIVSCETGINVPEGVPADFVSIKGNTIWYNDEAGIRAYSPRDWTIDGNGIYRNSIDGAGLFSGIELKYDATRAVIIQNITIINNDFHGASVLVTNNQAFAVDIDSTNNLYIQYINNYDIGQQYGGFLRNASSALHKFNFSRVYEASAVPDGDPIGGTWFMGDFVENSVPAAGGGSYAGWVCTTTGTFGAYAQGLTATTDGTTTVTLSGANTELQPGQYVTINSASRQIISVSGTTMVVSAAIGAASGQAIAYTAPVFKGYGLLET